MNRDEAIAYGIGEQTKQAIDDWRKWADVMANYDIKLAYLLRDISKSLKDYKTYCQSVKDSMER